MNILVEFSSLDYVLKHEIAKHLGALYPGSKFIALCGTFGNAYNYLKEQTDLSYSEIIDVTIMQSDFLKQEVDYAVLREFELTTQEKSLWHFVAGDRTWGYCFNNSAYMPRRHIHGICNNENIVKVVYGYIKFFTDLFVRYDINLFLPTAGMTNIVCPILEQICNNNGALYLLHETLRTGNYIGITPNRMYTFPHIDETYRRALKSEDQKIYTQGLELYDQAKKALIKEEYFDKRPYDHLRKKYPFLRFLARIPFILFEELRQWRSSSQQRKNSDDLLRQDDDLRSFLSNVIYHLRRRFQAVLMFDSRMYSAFNFEEKYVYLPLHTTPEYSTQIRAPLWIDQVMIIEALAKSIPIGWKLFVKEHPGSALARARYASFYRQIQKFPNVSLVPTTTEGSKLVKHAQLVFNIAGTSGWEAVQAGTPVINIAPNIYDALELSVRCTDIDCFSVAIYNELKRSEAISEDVRKKRLIYFFGAMREHAFSVDEPLKVLCGAPYTRAEAVAYGGIISENIKKYIDRQSCCKGDCE